MIGKILIGITIISSCIFTYMWTFNNEQRVISHLIDFANWGDFMLDVYMKPWARSPPYLFGLLLGIFYF